MKISVAICTYNGENFLRDQIDSILNQSLKVEEIVICDDCSSDTTWEILNDYQKKHPNLFQIHKNEVNLKSNKNFEKAITLCQGDYIFLSDQDDIWRNDKVEKTLAVFDQNPETEGVFSNGELINEKGKIIDNTLSLWNSFSFYESKIDKPIDLFDFLLLNGNFLTGATLCIKKEIKHFCLPFQTSNTIFHDEWIALILSKRKTLYYSTEKLIFYRLHDSQQTGIKDTFLNKKEIKNQELQLKLKEPKTFNDYKFITNRYFSAYERYTSLKHKGSEIPILSELINEIIELYKKFDLEMKKKYPIWYFLRKRKNDKKGRMQIDTKL